MRLILLLEARQLNCECLTDRTDVPAGQTCVFKYVICTDVTANKQIRINMFVKCDRLLPAIFMINNNIYGVLNSALMAP